MTPAPADNLRVLVPRSFEMQIGDYAHEIFIARVSRIRPNTSEIASMYYVSIELKNNSTIVISRSLIGSATIYRAVYSE